MVKWEMSRSFVRIHSNSITLQTRDVVPFALWLWVSSFFSLNWNTHILLFCFVVEANSNWPFSTHSADVKYFYLFCLPRCYLKSMSMFMPLSSTVDFVQKSNHFPFDGCQAAVSWEFRAIPFVLPLFWEFSNIPYVPAYNYPTLAGSTTIPWIFCYCSLHA